mmetsp:Transcript_30966/g.27394  ORF Transcript_30966/g.27394 Transcript_30966/m.27394 type:complete len:116 (+) Transcript_30966:365-712(+)
MKDKEHEQDLEESFSSSASKETNASEDDLVGSSQINKKLVNEFLDDKDINNYFPLIDEYEINKNPYASQTEFLINGMFKNPNPKTDASLEEVAHKASLLPINTERNKFFTLTKDL